MSPYLANNQPTALSHVPLSCYEGATPGAQVSPLLQASVFHDLNL